MKTRWFVAPTVLVAAITGILYSQNGGPTSAEIAKLEICVKQGRLPKNQYDPKTPQWTDFSDISIDKYARYYATENRNGEKVIVGELVGWLDPQESPGIHTVSDVTQFPKIFDGGCGVVHLVYSIREGTILAFKCNGRG